MLLPSQATIRPGRKLSLRLRRQLELLYLADFSTVRFVEHQLPADMGARAFASGNTVVFAPGELDWASSAGLRLIGHELAHVVQQSRIRFQAEGVLTDPQLEDEANTWGERLARLLCHLEIQNPLRPATGANKLGNVVQCASKAMAVASYLFAPVTWAWNSLPTLRQGTTQAVVNQESITATNSEVAEKTALTKQEHMEAPVFVPPPAPPVVLTAEEQALAIHKMTLAENMARLTPLQMQLRNAVLSRSASPVPLPPTALALDRGRGQLQATTVAARPVFPDARGVVPGALANASLKHVDTREVDFQRDVFPQLKQDAIEERKAQSIQNKQIDFSTRVNALKTSLMNIDLILPDPTIPGLRRSVTAAYKAVPDTGSDGILAQLDTTLVLLAQLEARVKESAELIALLNREEGAGFFAKYFDSEITGWTQLGAKLEEKNTSGLLVLPRSWAAWDGFLNEYNNSPRDKARMIGRIKSLITYLDSEAMLLRYGNLKSYRRGFVRQVSGGTGSFECNITITEGAWNAIQGGDGNPEQIQGILSQNPVPIQKDGTTKGNRAIKPEPYGWIFSTSGSLRLVSNFPKKGVINWPPAELVFDVTKKAEH